MVTVLMTHYNEDTAELFILKGLHRDALNVWRLPKDVFSIGEL